MKNLISLSVFTFLLSSIAAYSQMKKIEFEEFTLDNGLQVILHEDKTAPVVIVSVMYHVGSKDERPDRNGFAHFFEHLLFEETANIPRGEFTNYVQNNGGALNANTWYDRTYYYVVLPSNQLALGMWLESERMVNARVDQRGVDTQRSVVKEERSQSIDNRPYGSVLEQTMMRAFRQHPYRWSVIGDMGHLDAAGVEDFEEFYRTYYIPNNAILSVAGNLDKDEAKRLINKYFATIPAGPSPKRTQIKEPSLVQEIRDTVYDNIQLPAVIHAYRIPEQTSGDYYALNLLSRLLSQGSSSRFNKAIVDDKQLALFVSNIPLFLEHPGVSINFGIANVGVDAQKLEHAMDAELERLKSEGISSYELQKLKNQIENDFLNQNATIAGIAERLANYKMFFGDAGLINTELERYLEVTEEDLLRVAREFFVPDNRVTLHYLPMQYKQ